MTHRNRLILVALAAVLAIFTVGCSFNISTAKITDAIMTDSIDENGMPGNTMTSFSSDASIIYTSAKILNAPDNTQIRIVWIYATSGEQFNEVKLDSGDISDRYIYSSFEPSTLMPSGDYQVKYYIEDRSEPDATVNFTVNDIAANPTTAGENNVSSKDGAYLEDAHMTSNMDEGGVPVDSITTVGPTGTWFVSTILRNAQPNTTVRFVWYDSEGLVIDDYILDPKGATDVYVAGSMELTTVAPKGEYRVDLYISDETQPAATVNFTVGDVDANSTATGGGFSSYSQAEGGFSINYPETWTIVESKENLAVKFNPAEFAVENEEEKINAVVVVALKSYAQDVTIEGVQQNWNDQLAGAGYENYKSVSSTIDSVNGFDMAISEYSWSYAGGDLYTMDFLIINGADLYVITFTATENALETLFPYVEQMVLSFNLL